MTSSPQSLADSALGAEGDFSTSPDQKEFREVEKKQNYFFGPPFPHFDFFGHHAEISPACMAR
jgi:hypothetical protein